MQYDENDGHSSPPLTSVDRELAILSRFKCIRRENEHLEEKNSLASQSLDVARLLICIRSANTCK